MIKTRIENSESRLEKQQYLFVNNCKIEVDPSLQIYEYEISISPEISNDSQTFQEILKSLKETISIKAFKTKSWFRNRSKIFLPVSKNLIAQKYQFQIVKDSQDYLVELNLIKTLNQINDFKNVINRVFQSCVQNLSIYQTMLTNKNEVFTSSDCLDFSAMNFQIFQGFYFKIVDQKQNLQTLNQPLSWDEYSQNNQQQSLSLCVKNKDMVIRLENVLEKLIKIREISLEQNADYQLEIKKLFVGVKIITNYNQKAYIIDEIDFSMNTDSKFELKTEKEKFYVTFYDYFTKKYGVDITQKKQPLIVARDWIIYDRNYDDSNHFSNEFNSKQRVYLVPELCNLVGMTEAMRNIKSIWREIKQSQRVDAPIAIQKMEAFIRKIMSNEKTIQILSDWKISLSDRPLQLNGFKLDPGNIVMGQQTSHNIDFSGSDLGPKLLSHKLFDQKSIEKWGVFYQERDSNAAKNFVQIMEKILLSHDYQAKPMAMFPIQGNNIEIWANEIKNKLLQKGSSNVQIIILLIPGKNGKSQLYRELKKFTLQECKIITQIVLTGTLNYGKNQKMIISKILTQICTKIGGIPWINDSLPLFDKRTMICAINQFHNEKLKCQSVLGFVASYNKSATKYWSKSVIQEQIGQEICLSLDILIIKSLQNFLFHNDGQLPERVIFYRNNSYGKCNFDLFQKEIQLINQSFKDIKENLKLQQFENKQEENFEIKLVYVEVKRMSNTEIYSQGIYEDSYKNCIPGTVLELSDVQQKKPQFYLVSRTQRQGMSIPFKYIIHFDNIGESIGQLELLSYKLCYLYFNVMGPISVPAPIMYAKKLCNLVAEKNLEENEDGPFNQPINIHESFSLTLNSNPTLYFI